MPEQTGTLLVDQIADYQGPLAMAAESDLLYVRLLEGDSNRLLAELSRMGFDCCQALAQQQWLLRYSNSDIEQPSNDELQALLHPFRIESKSQVSSISLVGQGQNWQSQVKAQVSAIAEQRAIVFEWLDSQDPEHLILRVSQQQHEAMCRLLHQQIFENYEWPSSSTTGLSLWRESWQQLIEHR
jgi:aspartokinase